MTFSKHDRQIVRSLAQKVMEISALPVQDEQRTLWTRLNRLERVRPLVWINEIPWDELRGEELDCQSEHAYARELEGSLRTALYLWNHMRTDMVVDPFYIVNYVYHDSGFGLDEVTVRKEGVFGGFVAVDYVPIIKTEADIERILMPVITPDWAATEHRYEMACDLLGDVMPVVKRGIVHQWFAPWDTLIRWWGIEELFLDITDRPEFVHKGIARMVDAYLCQLDQLEALGLLSVSNGNHRVGSGGLGITDELPQPDYDGIHARPIDQWGNSTAQIFAPVSPAMHEEFALQHELRWLERFGLNCYGCCDPLDKKMGIARKIPRLRRVSMSPWIDLDRAVQAVGRDYIFSYKPTPAVFAWSDWNFDQARKDLVKALEKTRGCVVEVIMKDISTCRHEPRRIWEWCEMAMQVVEDYA